MIQVTKTFFPEKVFDKGVTALTRAMAYSLVHKARLKTLYREGYPYIAKNHYV